MIWLYQIYHGRQGSAETFAASNSPVPCINGQRKAQASYNKNPWADLSAEKRAACAQEHARKAVVVPHIHQQSQLPIGPKLWLVTNVSERLGNQVS